MITTSTAVRANLHLCATCRHIHKGPPIPARYSDFPQILYRCTLTNHRVNPNQTPCPLYEPRPELRYLPPTRPNTHLLIP